MIRMISIIRMTHDTVQIYSLSTRYDSQFPAMTNISSQIGVCHQSSLQNLQNFSDSKAHCTYQSLTFCYQNPFRLAFMASVFF